jgi:hypothetical protein
MVYPYTPLNPSSFYDIISQIIFPYTHDNSDNPEWTDDMVALGNQAISDLLFKNNEVEQENYNPKGDQLYLSKMFVYCVKLTEGFLNECALNEGVNDLRATKASFINHFLEGLNIVSKHNLLIHEKMLADALDEDIENLYQCALSFYSCQLICYLLNQQSVYDSYIQNWLHGIFNYNGIDHFLLATSRPIRELKRMLQIVQYRLPSSGGEWFASNQIALGFFSAYMTKDKMAWADDGRIITHFADADFTPEYQTLLSIFPDLESKSRFSEEQSPISGIGRHLRSSSSNYTSTISLSNSLKRSWSITGAVFQLIPPPDIPSNSVVATRTLNYSNRGFSI